MYIWVFNWFMWYMCMTFPMLQPLWQTGYFPHYTCMELTATGIVPAPVSSCPVQPPDPQ